MISSNELVVLRRQKARHQDDRFRTPVPTYRHAAPSAPWPWMDFDMDESTVDPPLPTGLVPERDCWGKYPQNLFPNWTPDQVRRSKMLHTCPDSGPCFIYEIDMKDDGAFDKAVGERVINVKDQESEQLFWKEIKQQGDSKSISSLPQESSQQPVKSRVRAFFVENMTLHILQMLGSAYDVEPFFFSSSANWIPSRYQEDSKAGKGDHITVTLPFVRKALDTRKAESIASVGSGHSSPKLPLSTSGGITQQIDTQAPLEIPTTNTLIVQDLLAIHMIRTKETSTIISYHPLIGSKRTSAKDLQSIVQRTGDSVYWTKIFKRSKDPTFLFLAILWFALYAWDEAFEALYQHITALEHQVLKTHDIDLTRELHRVQAHLLHYEQLLQDFKKSVIFVRDTRNPAMEAGGIALSEEQRADSMELMTREASHLISEIDRLESQRKMHFERLQNVIHLAFATVNIEDSRAMQRLTEASMRDSTAMKQISYLTMVFLPASLIASVFGMNVGEINPGTKETLSHYAEATVILTVVTAWLVIALQTESSFWPKGSRLPRRLSWPIFYSVRQAKESLARHGLIRRSNARSGGDYPQDA